MQISDWKSPGTVASVERNGGASWHDPNNVKVSDDSRAYAYTDSPNGTDWLRCTNFGFTTSDVPTGYDVVGIEMEFECYDPRNPASIVDAAIYLMVTAGQVGDNKASAVVWPQFVGGEAYRNYGGSSDAWGAGLSDSDVRSSDFGVDIAAVGDPAEHAGYIDHVRMRIYSRIPILDGDPGYLLGIPEIAEDSCEYLFGDARMQASKANCLLGDPAMVGGQHRYLLGDIVPVFDGHDYLYGSLDPVYGGYGYLLSSTTVVSRIPKPSYGKIFSRLSVVEKEVT